jgi:hypothetical protein
VRRVVERRRKTDHKLRDRLTACGGGGFDRSPRSGSPVRTSMAARTSSRSRTVAAKSWPKGSTGPPISTVDHAGIDWKVCIASH